MPRDDARSGACQAGFCDFPAQGNFVRFHCPLHELRFAHVRRERLHNSAVWNSGNKVRQGFLVLPNREGPKFTGKRRCIQRIADKTRRVLQLTHDFESEPEKFWQSAEISKRQVGN